MTNSEPGGARRTGSPRARAWLGSAVLLAVASLACTVTAVPARASEAAAAAQAPAPNDGSRLSQLAPAAPTVRFPADLPLRRETSSGLGGGHPGAAVVVLLVMVALGGMALLHGRRRLPPAGPTGERGLAAWIRGLGAAGSEKRLRILQSVRLTGHSSVHVLRWDGREWLIGCGEQGVTVLGRRSDPAGALAAGPSPKTSSTLEET